MEGNLLLRLTFIEMYFTYLTASLSILPSFPCFSWSQSSVKGIRPFKQYRK